MPNIRRAGAQPALRTMLSEDKGSLHQSALGGLLSPFDISSKHQRICRQIAADVHNSVQSRTWTKATTNHCTMLVESVTWPLNQHLLMCRSGCPGCPAHASVQRALARLPTSRAFKTRRSQGAQSPLFKYTMSPTT